jgi:hypothetical protein
LLLSRPSHWRDAPRVRRDRQGPKGLRDRKDLKANKARQGLKAQKATKVARGRKDLKAQKANKVPRDHKGHRARRANKVLRALPVPLVKQVQVPPGHQDYMRSGRIRVTSAAIATSLVARAKSWFL